MRLSTLISHDMSYHFVMILLDILLSIFQITSNYFNGSLLCSILLCSARSIATYFCCQERMTRKARKIKTKRNRGTPMMQAVWGLHGTHCNGMVWNGVDMFGSVWLVVHDCSGVFWDVLGRSVAFWGVLDDFWLPFFLSLRMSCHDLYRMSWNGLYWLVTRAGII